jgi:Zn finger protein HypA/HybF involved in hydrogenase expression
MHETSLVAELIEECERRADGRPVTAVRVRHAASIDDDGLREIFSAYVAGGPLEHALLESETFDVVLDCGECGFSGAIDTDHLYGHVRVCPGCGAVTDDHDSAELQLLGVVLST